MAQQEMSAVLVADLGNVHTRLVLIDLVEGQYRLVASSRARSTAAPPVGRAILGLQHAAADMSELTGRKLIDPESRSVFVPSSVDASGIDAFLATSSAGRPMRVFLVGLTSEFSLASARRALNGTYVNIVDTLTPDDMRTEEQQINAILSSQVDLIMIAGGTDGGTTELVRDLAAKVETAISLASEDQRPTILYAGNRALRNEIKARFDPYTTAFVSNNVRPKPDDEELLPAQIELAFVYDEYRGKSGGGFSEVGRLSAVGVVPTMQGYISAVRYLGDKPGPGPLCIDVGSAISVIATSLDHTPHYTIHTDLGVGHSASHTLDRVTPDAVRRWLPFEISDDTLYDYMANKQLRPSTIPGTAEDLLIEQALAREIVRALADDARPAWNVGAHMLLPQFNPIIAAGAVLTEAPHPGISALLLLDALQPVGQVDLKLDPHNLISALGVVAYLEPVITVQALEAGGLINLGTAFCPLGRARQGSKAMTVRLNYGDDKQIEHVVRGGDIWMAPLLPGEQVEVDLRLARGLSINGKRRVKGRFVAGAAGLIFDARGRMLVLPREKDRAQRFTEWQMAMLGREPLPAKSAKPAAGDVPTTSQPDGENHAVLS